ncbi:MAG: primase [Thermosediminibacterales bacterium]|nr:primase [Thermosediminibacterales bacterium]
MKVVDLKFSEDLLSEIRDKNDIVTVVSEYVSLKKSGKNYIGLCPFHSEKTPSFTVNPDKQMFYCFGCGIGGNVYTFIMQKEHMKFPEAVRFLAERAGIILPEEKEDPEYLEKLRLKKKFYEINRIAARYFYNCLVNSDQGVRALNYLKSRGISITTIKSFGIGYSLPDWEDLICYLKAKGYKETTLEKAGLAIKRKNGKEFYDRFRGRIMFPIFDIQNNIIGFGGRVIDDSKPKYLNSPESEVYNKRKNLYGLNFVKKHLVDDRILIVEGYMDVISLHQYGIKQAVASLGTSLTSEQAKLLRRYVKNVVVAYDADTAGISATLRGMDILKNAGLNVKVVMLPKGSDPDEYIRRFGKEAFLEKVDKSYSLIDFKIKHLENQFDLKNLQGRVNFLNRVVPIISEIDNEIEKDVYIKKLSQKLNITEESIRLELKKTIKTLPVNGFKHNKGIKWNDNKERLKIITQSANIKAERDLINLMITDKSYYKRIFQEIDIDFFSDEDHKQIIKAISKAYENKDSLNSSEVIDYLEDERLIRKASSAFSGEVFFTETERILQDCIKTLKTHKLNKRIQSLQDRLKKLEKQGDYSESKQILAEIKTLQKQTRII